MSRGVLGLVQETSKTRGLVKFSTPRCCAMCWAGEVLLWWVQLQQPRLATANAGHKLSTGGAAYRPQRDVDRLYKEIEPSVTFA